LKASAFGQHKGSSAPGVSLLFASISSLLHSFESKNQPKPTRRFEFEGEKSFFSHHPKIISFKLQNLPDVLVQLLAFGQAVIGGGGKLGCLN